MVWSFYAGYDVQHVALGSGRVGLIPMTTATGMGSLPELLEARAGSRAVTRTFHAARLPEELVSDRAHRVPFPALVALFAHAGRYAGDRVLGLEVGLQMDLTVFGRWMHYGMNAPTLAAGVARLDQALALHQTGCSLALLGGEDHEITFRYLTPPCARDDAMLHSDHVVPIMIKFVRHFAGGDWLPAWVEVNYPPHADTRSLTDRLPVQWRFGGPGISIALDEDMLTRLRRSTKTITAHGRAHTDLVATDELRACASPVHAIRATVALGLLDRRFSLDGVAARLDMSVRSVQRTLDTEGTSYRRVLDDVRRAKAEMLLAQTSTSIAEIALTLCYDDPANFTRAFRRWTGATPGEYRSRTLPRHSQPPHAQERR